MSSWLDNIAAHGGVAEEEEEEEEQPQKQVAKPVVREEKASSAPIVAETEKINQKSPKENVTSTQKAEPAQSVPKEPIPKESAPQNSSPVFKGESCKEMSVLNKSLHVLLKKQESLYAGSMLKTRSSVDFALEKTSRPIQTIGGLGKISLEAKSKYDSLKKRIMIVPSLCSVAPKTQ